MNAIVARQRGTPLRSRSGCGGFAPGSMESDCENVFVGASVAMGQCDSAKGCRAKCRSKRSRTCAAVSFIFSLHSAVLARGRVLSSKRLASASSTGTSAGSSEGLGSDSSVFAPVCAWIPYWGIDADTFGDDNHEYARSSRASTWRYRAGICERYLIMYLSTPSK